MILQTLIHFLRCHLRYCRLVTLIPRVRNIRTLELFDLGPWRGSSDRLWRNFFLPLLIPSGGRFIQNFLDDWVFVVGELLEQSIRVNRTFAADAHISACVAESVDCLVEGGALLDDLLPFVNLVVDLFEVSGVDGFEAVDHFVVTLLLLGFVPVISNAPIHLVQMVHPGG